MTRIPDQTMIIDQQQDDLNYVIATRDSEGTYAMIYFPTGKTTEIDLSSLNGETLKSWWYDPRTGAVFPDVDLKKSSSTSVDPPSSGPGNDWVLVVDAENSDLRAPGKIE